MSTVTHAVPRGVEHPGFVPALLLADAVGGPDDVVRRPVRRSARDWLVDVAAFLLSVLAGLLLVVEVAVGPAAPAAALLWADVVAGLVACLALWWRRRWPVGVALLTAALGTFSDASTPAVLVALFTVAVHRRWPAVVVAAAVNVAGFAVYLGVRSTGDVPAWLVVGLGLALLAGVVAWGMFVRARRQLVLSLRDRALRAEDGQRLRVEQARQLERTRIAREMHDVLAHRLSLLSMHAGALEFRPDAPPAEVTRAAGIVRASARQALDDLREVIGVLRDSTDGVVRDRPQPTLGDLPALVEESRAAGLRVASEYRVPDLGAAPAVTGRTAYRVVQEALTNVRKHAPGAVATVRVAGTPAEGLTVEVSNPAPVGGGPVPALPSAGTGLVGLRERVGLAGGRLEHSWTPGGGFRVYVWLPWDPVAAPA